MIEVLHIGNTISSTAPQHRTLVQAQAAIGQQLGNGHSGRFPACRSKVQETGRLYAAHPDASHGDFGPAARSGSCAGAQSGLPSQGRRGGLGKPGRGAMTSSRALRQASRPPGAGRGLWGSSPRPLPLPPNGSTAPHLSTPGPRKVFGEFRSSCGLHWCKDQRAVVVAVCRTGACGWGTEQPASCRG